jgi:crossover junction endodeoxyribonuclease RuvC
MIRLLIGIDPGVGGSLAFSYDDELSVEDFPTEKITTSNGSKRTRYKLPELAQLLRDATHNGALPCLAILEQVGPRPTDGSIQGFTLGRGLGAIEGVLAGLGIEVLMVVPQKWKRDMKLNSDKENSRQEALKLFPQLADRLSRKKDEGRAEALLLLEWYKRHKEC